MPTLEEPATGTRRGVMAVFDPEDGIGPFIWKPVFRSGGDRPDELVKAGYKTIRVRIKLRSKRDKPWFGDLPARMERRSHIDHTGIA